MNAYFVVGEEYDDIVRGCGLDCDIVFAETRGQARATFVHADSRYREWLTVHHTLRLASDLDRLRGVVQNTDPLYHELWRRADQAYHPIRDRESPHGWSRNWRMRRTFL